MLSKRWLRSLTASLVVTAFAGVALADWDPGDEHKMHYPQTPDLNGWDVSLHNEPPGGAAILADDWQCTESGWIDDIHFWTSWRWDMPVPLLSVRVRIYGNYPVGHPSNPYNYSIPGELLSGPGDWVFDVGDFTERVYDYGLQGWFDPITGDWEHPDHQVCYQINITNIRDIVPEEQWVWQDEGEIYWLAIRVIQSDEYHFLGWKNSGEAEFMDAAVFYNPYMPPPSWDRLIDPFYHYRLDLAFVITSKVCPPEEGVVCEPQGEPAGPPNGGFEADAVGASFDAITDWDHFSTGPLLAENLEIVGDHYYSRSKSVYSFMQSGGQNYNSAWQTLTMETPASTDAGYVTLWITDDGYTTSSRYAWHIQLNLSDGLSTPWSEILRCDCWGLNEGCTPNNYDYYDATAVGADGRTWKRYTRAIPAYLDKSTLTVEIAHRQASWDGTQATSWYYLDDVYFSDAAGNPAATDNPTHPTTYWYQVTYGGFCDFHVRVYDPNPANYTNWVAPANWVTSVHQVGDEWWASWWDPTGNCLYPIFDCFTFSFDNSNPSVWGDWSITVGNSPDPYYQMVDSSGAHADEEDGYGYRVHVPKACPEEEGVVCEPQDGVGTTHPPDYWYEVTYGGFCDFHVRVFDSNPANYTNWVAPANWVTSVHQVGDEWWASWWDPSGECLYAIFDCFTFGFDNSNPSVWGDWSITVGNSPDPYYWRVDGSANHSAEEDGYGYRVHVPKGCPEEEGVVCEPQEGQGTTHPPDYWYEVTYGGFCDFHVRVFDSSPANYTNWVAPANWLTSVHQVGNEWWASWWDPSGECLYAIFDCFTFGFDNNNPSVWGDWSITVGNSPDPYYWRVDGSENHAAEEDGYGYRVHVPTTAPPPPEPPPPDQLGSHVGKNRYISMVIPTEGAGQGTAIRVKLTSLHHPATPANPPNFGNWEGKYRWVNAVDINPTGGLHTCDDSLALHTTFKCAKLGCAPEYRDWAGELGGAPLHVTGAAVVPSSTYDAAQLAASCAGNEASCAAVSEELSIFTTLFGNVDNDPQLNVLDVAAVVDKVKDLPVAFIKPRTQLQPDVPDPTANVNVLDAATAVDALKGKAYGYFGDFGPCTDACPGEDPCP